MHKTVVRSATMADAAGVDRLQCEAFPGDALLLTDVEIRERVEGRKAGALLVAEVNNELAGYCVLTDRPFRPWTGWDFLAVSPAYHRQGIACALTGAAFEQANRPFIRGFVRAPNIAALALYRRNGFVRTGVKKAHYTTGEDAVLLMTFVPLAKRLRASALQSKRQS